MSHQDLFDRIVASLNEAMLDDADWPQASALVDEICGSKGNILVSGEGGLGDDLEVYFARCCYRGERRGSSRRSTSASTTTSTSGARALEGSPTAGS